MPILLLHRMLYSGGTQYYYQTNSPVLLSAAVEAPNRRQPYPCRSRRSQHCVSEGLLICVVVQLHIEGGIIRPRVDILLREETLQAILDDAKRLLAHVAVGGEVVWVGLLGLPVESGFHEPGLETFVAEFHGTGGEVMLVLLEPRLKRDVRRAVRVAGRRDQAAN